MKLLSPTPTLRALLRATPLFAWSENKFLLAAYSTTVFTTRFHRSHFLGPRCAIKCAKENNPLTEAQTWRLNPFGMDPSAVFVFSALFLRLEPLTSNF